MKHTKFVNHDEEKINSKKGTADIRRQETLKDLNKKLDKYGKCALVRCTGFGKTWMLERIMRDYKKVLYLYPADVVKNTVVDRYNQIELGEQFCREVHYSEDSVKNTTFMTYMCFVGLSDEDFKEMDYDLVVFDEAHRLGAKLTKIATAKLFGYLPAGKTKYIGATATPEREDSFDFVSKFFDNVCVYHYTLHDAIQDGIIKKPYYVYCTTDIETDIKESMTSKGICIDDNSVIDVIKKSVIEGSNLFNIENIIKETIKQYRPNRNYYKFIVFYTDIKSIQNNMDKVEGWFRSALGSKYTISSIKISSYSKEETRNVDKLNSLRDDGTRKVNLIHCVDMLNMGTHISDLTGIVMYRATSSSIIFNQQLGRALSTGYAEPSIVFDIVDNLHRKAAFDLTERPRSKRNRKDGFKDRSYTIEDVMAMSDEEIISLSKECFEVDSKVNIGYDLSNFKDVPLLRNRLVSLIENDCGSWWRFCNKIGRQDINMTGIEATYLEFIAKVVAEPLAFRVRTSVANHYLLYCALSKNPCNFSQNEVYELGRLSDSDFVNYMRNAVSKDKSDYPIFSSEDFLDRFVTTDDKTFKLVLSSWNVTIKEVLDLIGVS